MSRTYYGRDKERKEHDAIFAAINKETGQFFGGKSTSSQTGYSKIGYLKSAMTNAKAKHEDYHFVHMWLVDGGIHYEFIKEVKKGE